jgi:predicted AAA+ superfamily ATPase
MTTIERRLSIDLPEHQSAFLWGPRKTGKTTYLKQRFPKSLTYDFLKTDLFLDMTRRPALLREQVLAAPASQQKEPIILDEVQKVPQLLDEVHWLIENTACRFILCGSSARKLKRGHANLLGGRAWKYHMFPLVSDELGDIDLLKILNDGLVPAHYLQANATRSLKAYLEDYLKEEVFDEGLTRNVPAFSRFFDAIGFTHGELTNFSDIARDCGVDSKTVREYYQILVDTLMGDFVEPYKRRQNRQVITKSPKFYLFDPGVARILTRRPLVEERGEFFGKAFEHYLFTELRAHSVYEELDYPIRFWRTKVGQEVDFILGDGEVAVEVKSTSCIEKKNLRGLKAFAESNTVRQSIVVCNESRPRVLDGIQIVPWRDFLYQLWGGEIIQ